MKIPKQCEAIELVLSDVDGVLTDGGIVFDNQGIETKGFSIKDGMGIALWKASGRKFGIVTGRTSHIVKVRAAELGMDPVRQGFQDKRLALQEISQELGISVERIAYIGDDLPDIGAIRLAGCGFAVADAAEEVRGAADYVTAAPGGRGAVREVIEIILKAQDRWEELIQRYVG